MMQRPKIVSRIFSTRNRFIILKSLTTDLSKNRFVHTAVVRTVQVAKELFFQIQNEFNTHIHRVDYTFVIATRVKHEKRLGRTEKNVVINSKLTTIYEPHKKLLYNQVIGNPPKSTWNKKIISTILRYFWITTHTTALVLSILEHGILTSTICCYSCCFLASE